MPWFDSTPDDYSHLSSQETCRLLRAYNRDIAKAKFFVKVAPNSPAGVFSQWERILSHHRIVVDEVRKDHLGDTEISWSR